MKRFVLFFLTIFMIGLLPGCGIKLVPRYPEGMEGVSSSSWDDSAGQQEQPQPEPVQHATLNKSMYNTFITEIKRYMGAPYVWGGASPAGTDCSGFIMALYKNAANVSLPHSTVQLSRLGTKVPVRDLKFADLIFFNDGQGKNPTHVGFYLAKGQFVHASVSSGVIVSQLAKEPFRKQYLGAKRILE